MFDAIIVLECPSLDRTGLEEHLAERPVINIDHHLGNQHYGAVNWVDTAAPAVGEMVYRLAQGLKVALEPETASLPLPDAGHRHRRLPLLQRHRRPPSRRRPSLVRDGAHPEQVSQWLYESQPLARRCACSARCCRPSRSTRRAGSPPAA